MNFFITFLLILFYFNLSSSTLSKSDKKKKYENKNEWMDEYDNINVNVNDIKKSEKIDFDVNKKIFNGVTLGYVTPWNGFGYDIAKNLTKKFNIISPVWLQLHYDGSTFIIKGDHDIDKNWIRDVKENYKFIKILPRIIFEGWKLEQFKYLVRNQYKLSECFNLIKDLLNKYDFDGIVLEFWLQIGVYSPSESIEFVHHLYEELKSNDRSLILVIPPPIYENERMGYISKQHLDHLSNQVDYFSLMTYDYSNTPGPNSPIKWIKKCVEILTNEKSIERTKILIGLNFYGNSFNGPEGDRSIIRHELLELLQNAVNAEIHWDTNYKEHYFRIRDSSGNERIVWYPTTQSIDLRLKLANHLGVGISIWELGQGLLNFYSIL